MSIIIKKTQKKYRISLIVEFFFLCFIFFVLSFIKKDWGYGFLAGSSSAFLPYCFIVWFIFFIKRRPNQQLKAFYIGEIVKFSLTTVFIIFTLLYFEVNMIIFFLAYFLSITLNNLIPFVVNKNQKFYFK